MITKVLIENRFSKNMATINYWLREMCFPNYDSLFWKTQNSKTTIHRMGGEVVAEVKWYHTIKGKQDFFIPKFLFKDESWQENQIGFWILRNLEKEINEPLRNDHSPECRCKQCKLDKGID